MTETGEQS